MSDSAWNFTTVPGVVGGVPDTTVRSTSPALKRKRSPTKLESIVKVPVVPFAVTVTVVPLYDAVAATCRAIRAAQASGVASDVSSTIWLNGRDA